MSETPFHTFIELIKVDQTIVDLQHLIDKLHQEIKALKNQEQEFAAVVLKAKNEMHDAKKEVDKQELELKSLDQREKQKKEQLENLTDHKQYQALKNEIDGLKNKQHQLEEVLVSAWNQLESTQKEFEFAQAEYPTKADDINGSIKQKESEISTLQTQLDEQNNQRPSKEKTVPAEWLEKYAMMRSRVTDPVVPVLHGNCSACFYKITEQDLSMLRKRALLQCKSCYRLLYSSELEKAGPPSIDGVEKAGTSGE